MNQSGEKVKVTVHEKDFEVVLFEDKGKVFAKSHINNFGEITVPDLGGGRDRALRNMQARIANILTALQDDTDRETKKQQRLQEQEAKKQQQIVQNN
jgi:Skp family chaperone for outer membrane proteins